MKFETMSHARAWQRGALCALIGAGVLPIACVAARKEEQASSHASGASGGSGTRAKGEEGSMGSGAAERGGDINGYAQAPAGIMGAPSAVTTPLVTPLAAPTTPALDPNARYATTYRPGGAALAAFDAALARGSVPAVYKDLVGDFGARYAPSIPKPETGAMSFQVDTARAAVGPAGGALDLRIAMRSTDAMPSRAQLSVHLVLDVSGSMSGASIDNARKAAATLVEKLDPTDDFSMTTFSNEAHVLVVDGAIGSRRELVLAKIREVRADGGTNISAGLDLGYAQAHAPQIPDSAVKIVMLLSDGHANAGDTSASGLAERSAHAFQDGIQTSSFGLGADFDAPLMSTIADRGAGGYYYLADSSQIAPALTRELDARLVPAAQAVEVRVRLRPDVAPVKVFGSRQLATAEAWAVRKQEIDVDTNAQKKDGIKRDRQDDASGGMRFFMPAFARGDRHAMLLTLMLPAGTGERSIASVEIRYKDRLTKKNVTQEIPVRVRYAASDEGSAATIDESVQRTSQAFAAGDAIFQAASMVDVGNRAGAAHLLDERAEILKRAASSLHEPMFAEDGARLARLSSAVLGTGSVQDPLPLAVMLRGSAYGYLR